MEELVHVDPMENPEQANAMIAAVLNDTASPSESEPKPTMEPPPDGLFKLPGTGKSVEVRELTGADEEALAKVQGPFSRWVSTLLELAVEKIDNKSADSEAVGSLLIGDRDYLLMAIRKVTWGPEIELSDIECSGCHELYDVVVHTDEIPVRTLKNADEAQFTVALRNERVAKVRLPNGNDQAFYMERENTTDAQRNTLLLQRCVESITDAHGVEMPVAGFPSMVREGLSLPDRTRLLREINNRMPGARYNEVPVPECPSCGKTTVIALGPVALFPDLYFS